MSLALYGHPFSSYTQKVLIALYENDTPFEFRCIGPDTPQHSAEWLQRWPLRKFPDRCACCPRTQWPRWTCASSTASSTCTS